jgi:riboflavin kinase/FMN adenylyltransferase
MRVFRHFAPIPAELKGAVLALGNFDGVHRGHQAVIARAAAEARRSGRKFGVLTFEPHPRQYFAPATAPFRLTPFRVKMHQIEALGCDLAVSLHFDRALAARTAEDFAAEILHQGLGAAHVVVGYDFVFGKGRAGDAALLRRLGDRLGFGVTVVEPAGGADGQIFSSTEIRDRLAAGDVAAAAQLLGRCWEIDGRVEGGDRLGRTLGYPTANIALGEYLRPAAGIYAVRAGIEGASIGTRPTVNGTDFRLEVHILDFAGDLYGRHMRVPLVAWIRPELKFAGLAELTAAIGRDVEQARAILSGATRSGS